MEKLTAEQVKKEFKLDSKFYVQFNILKLKKGEALKISFKEWPYESKPESYVHYYKRYSRKFNVRTKNKFYYIIRK